MMANDDSTGVRQVADNSEIEFPFLKYFLGELLPVWAQNHQHALLAFRQHHVVGSHAGLALRHPVQV